MKRGFTLIELLVVLAIMGILAAVVGVGCCQAYQAAHRVASGIRASQERALGAIDE